jgi:hypothetical protein
MSRMALAPTRTRLLSRINGLRCVQAQRALLAACQRERDADSERLRIEAQLAAMQAEEARCAGGAGAPVSLAAVQAAQQRGVHLREQAQARQADLRAAQQALQQRRAERERGARQYRLEQARADWLQGEAVRARVQAHAALAAADDESALELGTAVRGAAREG